MSDNKKEKNQGLFNENDLSLFSENLSRLNENLKDRVTPWEQDLSRKEYQEERVLLEKVETERIYRRKLLGQIDLLHTLRKSFASGIFLLTVLWILFIIVFLILVSANVLKLSDAVLITLLATTTLNVFTFFYIVAKYIFTGEKKAEDYLGDSLK